MKYIEKSDIDLIETLNLVFNLQDKGEKVLKELEHNYKSRPGDPQAAFAYGFFNFLIASREEATVLDNIFIEKILNAYNDVLKLVPDYWIVLMFKSTLLLSLPEVLRSDDDLAKTFEKMLEIQRKAQRQEAYFIVPYIMYADYLFSGGKREKVFDLLKEADLVVIKEEIPYKNIAPYFFTPVKTFFKRLIRSNEHEIALKIRDFGQKYFPEEKVFLQEMDLV